MRVTDQLQRPLRVTKPLQRIISLVPSQTELLVDLGLEDRLVGITKFCVHPKHLIKTKRVVGGTKSIHWDRVEALQPHIILCNKEENTKEIVEKAQQLCLVHISDIITLEDNHDMMRDYGKLFGVEHKVNNLLNNINAGIQDLERTLAHKPRKTIAYFIWRKPYMVAGGNTFINSLIKLAGFINYYESETRYPEKTLEQLAKDAKEIDYIFLASEPFPFKAIHKSELSAVKNLENIILVDGEYFSWYGSRLVYAFKYFKSLERHLT